MTQQIEQQTRAQIAEFLPRALGTALASYQLFLEREYSDKPKEFKEHHDACKVAIAHVQLLIKLAEWANLPDKGAGDEPSQAVLATMIESAQVELGKKILT